MKRVLLALLAAFGLAGVGFANVAKIGDTEYATLAAAVEAVPTDGTETTITMIANETSTVRPIVAETQKIILDLNGKTYAAFESSSSYALMNRGTLTITDTGTGGKVSALIYNGGTLTLTGGSFGTFNSIKDTDDVINIIGPSVTLAQSCFKSSGTVILENVTYNYGLDPTCKKLTAKNCTIKGNVYIGSAIRVYEYIDCTITGTLTVNAGTFTLNGGSCGKITNKGGALTVKGDVVVTSTSGNALYNQSGTTIIEGGTFVAAEGATESVKCWVGSVTLPNGTVMKDQATVIQTEGVWGDLMNVKTVRLDFGSSYSYETVTTFEEVMAKVTESTATTVKIKLLTDFPAIDAATISSGKTVTLDLNGSVLTASAPLFTVQGALTITDTSVGATGSIIGSATVVKVDGGSFTHTAGTLGIGTADTPITLSAETAVVEIVSGTYTPDEGAIVAHTTGAAVVGIKTAVPVEFDERGLIAVVGVAGSTAIATANADATVTILGGSYTKVGQASTDPFSIRWGTFDVKPEDAYLMEGCSATQNDTGKWEIAPEYGDVTITDGNGVVSAYRSFEDAVVALAGYENPSTCVMTLQYPVVLKKGVALSATIPGVIDLGGNTISIPNASGTLLTLKPSGSLTIKNGTITGVVTGLSPTQVIEVSGGTDVVFENLTVINTHTDNNAVVVGYNGVVESFTAKNCTFTAADRALWIYNCNKTVVEGSTCSANEYVLQVASGVATVTNCTINKGSGGGTIYSALYVGKAIEVSVDQCQINVGTGRGINIASGSPAVVSVTGDQTTVEGAINNGSTSATLAISGGTFSADPTAYLASGYEATQDDATGLWGVKQIIEASVTVNGEEVVGTVEIVIDAAIEAATEEGATDGVIDLTTNPVDDAKHNDLVTKAIQQIAAKGETGLTLVVDAEDATVAFDNAAITTIADRIDDTTAAETPVVLTVKEIAKEEEGAVADAEVTYEITMKQGEADVFPNEEATTGNAFVTVDYVATEGTKVFFVDGDGTREEVAYTKSADGRQLTFAANHFSTYIIAEAVAKIVTEGVDGAEPTTAYYMTLQEAIDAVPADATEATTIRLLADVDLNATVTIENKNVIIDGDKGDGTCYTLTGPKDAGSAKIVGLAISGGVVTLQNMNFTDFDNTSNIYGSVIDVRNGTSSFTAKNLTINLFTRDAFTIVSATKFLVDGCNIDCTPDPIRVASAYSLTKGFQIGSAAAAKNVGTISNTKVTHAESTYEDWSSGGIEVYANVELTIENCEITNSESGIVVDNYWAGKPGYTAAPTTVTVKNTTVETPNDEGWPVFIMSREGQTNTVSLNIESGTYTGYAGYIVNGDGGYLDTYDTNIIAISGGTFSETIPEEACATGFIPASTTDESGNVVYGVKQGSYVARNTTTGIGYETLEAALAAATDGQTIVMLQDVELANSLALPNLTLTLDLGGKTLSIEGVATSGVPAFKVDNGTIMLKNGTVKGNTPGTTTHSAGAAVSVSGSCALTLDGVKLIGGDSIDAGMGSALLFNNQAANASVTINNSTLQGGKTTPSGETVVGGGGNAIEMHADVASSVSITMTGENTLWASEYASPYNTATACVVYNSGNAASDAHALVSIAASGIINVTGGLLHNVDLSTDSEAVIKVTESGAISDNMDYVVNGKNAYTITDEGATVTVGALTAETAEAEINGTFYRSFVGAVNAAAEGETITLHKDVTVTSSYTLKKGVTVVGTVSGVVASVANTRYNTTTYYTTFTEASAALGGSWTPTLVMLADYTATDNIAIGDISGAGVVTIDTHEHTLTLGDYIFYSGSVEANKAPVQAYDTGTKCWYIAGESKLPDLFKKELTGDVAVQLNGDVYMTASTVLAGENVTIDLNGHEISNASSGSFAMAYSAGLPLFTVGESKLTITDSEGTGSLAQYEGSVFAGGITPLETPTLENCFTGIVDGVGSVSIAGGSYPVDPTPYLAEGYNTSIEDGKITVGKFVAKIGDKGYASLQDALDEATNGQTIVLLADVTTTADAVPTYTGEGTVTIDVNGHTLTATRGLHGQNILFTGGYGWYMYRNSNYQATDKFIVTPELGTCLELAAETKKGNQPSVIELYDDWTVPYDITLPSTHTTSYFAVAEGYDITVDLNGKTVTQEPCQGQPSGGSFTVYGGRLTIVDNSAEQSGKVIGTYSTGYPSGTTIYQSGLAAYCISGELILKGGTFTAEKALEGATKDEGVVRTELPGAKIVLDGAKVLGVNDYAVKNWGEFVFESGIITVEDATETKGILVGDGGTATLNKAPESGLVEIVESSVSTTVNVAGVQYAGKEPIVGEGLEIAGDWVVEEGMAVMIAGEPDTFYPTLAEAIAAAKDGETVTLLKSTSGSGIIVPKDTYATGLTVDFNGKTYTVNEDPLAGSTGTETLGFQLLKDNNITFKNGKIRATNPAVKMLVQNYSNLTLEGMTLDGTPSAYSTNNIQYVLSNNNGTTVLTGGTTITATDEQIAFDVCRYASYPSVAVTVEDATVNGTIEVSGAVADAQSASLTLTSAATLTGATLKIANDSLGAVVTKDAAATLGAPAGFDWVAQDDGSQKLTKLDVSESFTVKPNIAEGGTAAKGELGNDGLVTITATPNEGYTFVGWSGEGFTALDAKTNVTITVENQDADLIANFIPTTVYTEMTNSVAKATLAQEKLIPYQDIVDLSVQNPTIEVTENEDGTKVAEVGIRLMKANTLMDEDGVPDWTAVVGDDTTDVGYESLDGSLLKVILKPTSDTQKFFRFIPVNGLK